MAVDPGLADKVRHSRPQRRRQRDRHHDARAGPRGLEGRERIAGLMFATEFEFTLPCGYLDEHGQLHRDGIMRRATAADEILPLRDPRVVKNPAYLVIILLSRVV